MVRNGVITGASRGIGRETAVTLAKDKWHLVLQGRNLEALTDTCSMVEKAGGKATPVVADLSGDEGTAALVNGINSVPLHLLVNNAGVAHVKPFEETTREEWDETLAVNVTAPFLLTKKLYRVMAEGSCIVNILSVAARVGFANWSSYCMSKFALDGLMRSVREELRPRGIRVINIYPGATSTGMWESIPGDWPRGKMLPPAEVARAVRYAIERPGDVLVEDIFLGNISGTL
ncbi:MAG: SDR family oxidoreductase [Candidatus Zixiibacteriota bacterium]|nr:MAG: SDR family oxidoreductase [candidate division Zixibacteria bacterium]